MTPDLHVDMNGVPRELRKPDHSRLQCATRRMILFQFAVRVQVYNNDLMDIATLLRLNSAVPPSGSAAIPEHTDDSTPVRDHIQARCSSPPALKPF